MEPRFALLALLLPHLAGCREPALGHDDPVALARRGIAACVFPTPVPRCEWSREWPSLIRAVLMHSRLKAGHFRQAELLLQQVVSASPLFLSQSPANARRERTTQDWRSLFWD